MPDELSHQAELGALSSAMREGVCLHELVYNEAGQAVDYRIIDINPAYEAITGLPRQQAIGKQASELYGTGQAPYLEIYERVVRTGQPEQFETYFQPMGIHFSISVISLEKSRFATIFSDITAQKQTEVNQALLTGVLKILNQSGSLQALISDALRLIRDTTGFDAVGLRLRRGEDCPYFKVDGFSDEFLREENFLCARGGDGAITRDAEGRPVLECTCGLVLSGRTDPAMSCFTPGGSFWTNRSSELLALPPEADPRTNPRNRCIHIGYESVGLFPVLAGTEIIGLLQLNDRRPGRFTLDQVSYFEGVARNIGLALQRVAAEEALRDSEQKYRIVADFTHDWEFWIGADGRFRYNSPSCEEITGYNRKEFEIDPTLITKIVHPVDQNKVRAHLAEVAVNPDCCEMRFRIIRKDGEERWLGHVCQPVFDHEGCPLGRRASNRDITQTVMIEQEVLRSRQHLARAQEVAKVGNWLMDAKRNVLTWSDESYRLFEVPPGQPMTYEHFLASVHPADREFVDRSWQAALRREQSYDIEHRIVVDGKTKWVREKAELEFDDESGFIGGFGIVHDITDRKLAEEALQNLNTELEQRVLKRTSELETAHTKLLEQLEFRAKAEESLRSLSNRLLKIQEEERRTIARELHDQTGQSLTVLKLMVGRANREASEEMKPLLADIAGMITEIIKQVRSLSLSLRPTVLDDLGLVPAMESLFKQLHSQANLQVHFEHEIVNGITPDINIAAYRITQEALTNVMRHAGVKEVRVRLSSESSRLQLSVEDHGCGFDRAAAEANRSTGLSAMRERSALLGGACHIESIPGKGTIITVSLPLSNKNT